MDKIGAEGYRCLCRCFFNGRDFNADDSGDAMNDYPKWKPIPTTKAEMIKAVEETCRIATLPDADRFATSLNQQLGVLRFLAKHLPENENETNVGRTSKNNLHKAGEGRETTF